MGALVTAAEVIRDETTPGANTATRVGQNLVDIAQAVENGGQPLIYIAQIDATADPISVTEIVNTLGEEVSVILESSLFNFSKETPFVSVKTFLSASPSLTEDQEGVALLPRGDVAEGGVQFVWLSFDLTPIVPNSFPFIVKIEVYP